jgi:hypothetical protein
MDLKKTRMSLPNTYFVGLSLNQEISYVSKQRWREYFFSNLRQYKSSILTQAPVDFAEGEGFLRLSHMTLDLKTRVENHHSVLSDDRFKASSKTIPPYSAI